MLNISAISNSQQPLHEILSRELTDADEFRAESAFLNSGGLNYVMPEMRRILECEGSVYLVHGADFRITDPQAVRSLVDLSVQFENMYYFVHFHWSLSTRHTFHPKLYITTSDYQRYCAIIGSSNLTQGGMARNVEVNAVIRGSPSDEPVTQCLDIFESILDSDALMQPDSTFVEHYEHLHEKARELPPLENPPADLSERYQELIDIRQNQLETKQDLQPTTQTEFLIRAIENLSENSDSGYVGLEYIYAEARRLARLAGKDYVWSTFNNSLRRGLYNDLVGRGGRDLFERDAGLCRRYVQYRLTEKGKAFLREGN